MKLFGVNVPGTDRRYVECRRCGTADYRYVGRLGTLTADARAYLDNCRACGAHLGGDPARDYAAWRQWDALVAFYGMNAFAWAAIWFFPLAIVISMIWDFPERKVALIVALIWGAGWGIARSRRAHKRGEMFEKKRIDAPIDFDPPR